jgi:hypothetical protein
MLRDVRRACPPEACIPQILSEMIANYDLGTLLAAAQVMTQTGLDPNYVYQGNLTDPRDIGIAAALAVTAYGQVSGICRAENHSVYASLVAGQ